MYGDKQFNLINYYLLKHKSFLEICQILSITSFELIYYIDLINQFNAQRTPIIENEEGLKIAYSRRTFEPKIFPISKKTFQIMLVSDKHIDHIDDCPSYIDYVYNEALKRGVDYVFDLGDILNGPANRIRKPEKTLSGTLEGSLKRLVEIHDFDIPTYFVTGNHDIKFMEIDCCNIGEIISRECHNMFFLNNLFSTVQIGNLRINLSHGSIECQKISQIKLYKEYRFLTANKPHILCQGHFHTFDFAERNDIMLCQVPSLKKSSCDGDKIVSNSAGVIFLTVHEKKDYFEILKETVDLSKIKVISKRETVLSKKSA